jgi:hypothetical protein
VGTKFIYKRRDAEVPRSLEGIMVWSSGHPSMEKVWKICRLEAWERSNRGSSQDERDKLCTMQEQAGYQTNRLDTIDYRAGVD